MQSCCPVSWHGGSRVHKSPVLIGFLSIARLDLSCQIRKIQRTVCTLSLSLQLEPFLFIGCGAQALMKPFEVLGVSGGHFGVRNSVIWGFGIIVKRALGSIIL